MGILFKRRPRSESIEGTNDLENFGLAQISDNDDTIKVYDDPQVPLNYIRSQIRGNAQTDRIHFIVDTR